MAHVQAATRRRRDAELFLRYHRYGDPRTRNELVDRFLPLARKLARRYEQTSEPLDDLVQVASLALLKAIDRYEPTRGDAFTSFAVPTILGELKRHFRDTSWSLHVPRGMQERVLAVNDAIERLSRELGHSPSPQQIALKLDMPIEHVLHALEATAAYSTTSFDTPRRTGDDESGTVADGLGVMDERLELVEDSASIARGVRALPARERHILYLRFAESLTQAEVAERMGISQMHVSRLIRQAIDRVRVVTGVA
ncbi:MAG TPA: SigB/SigF/SigG family RNA polymerase sigma factor [Thermoleophilaceae bacterium]